MINQTSRSTEDVQVTPARMSREGLVGFDDSLVLRRRESFCLFALLSFFFFKELNQEEK